MYLATHAGLFKVSVAMESIILLANDITVFHNYNLAAAIAGCSSQ